MEKIKQIVYAGDSTVTFNKFDTYPQAGLSQGLLLYVKDEVFMRSFAVNGRSTKSFLDEGRLGFVSEVLAKDDLFLIQFGHNDEKKEDPTRFTEPFGDYQKNLKSMIDLARERGAHPVLITPITRRYFDEQGSFLPGHHGAYPKAMKELAAREQVPCIDLTQLTGTYVEHLGDMPSRALYVYPKDNTHLTHYGATVFAGMLAKELCALGEPYASFFIDEI